MTKRVIGFADDVDINRSASEVFGVVSDLPGLFAKLRNRVQLDVERAAGDGSPANGDVWRISGMTQLGRRSGAIEITEISAPNSLSLRATGRGFAVNTTITLTPCSRTRCTMAVQNEVFAMTFAARLLSPAIRLWRGRARKRLGKGLRRLKKQLER